MKGKNVIGPKVRRLRFQKGWSQQELAVKLQLAGLDIRRSGVGKIEAQLRRVTDEDLLYLLRVFEVGLEELLGS